MQHARAGHGASRRRGGNKGAEAAEALLEMLRLNRTKEGPETRNKRPPLVSNVYAPSMLMYSVYARACYSAIPTRMLRWGSALRLKVCAGVQRLRAKNGI